MPGAGTGAAAITSAEGRARLLDLTRLTSRAGRPPTGIDRVERAYLDHLSQDGRLWSLIRTSLGFLLLDPNGTRAAKAVLTPGARNPSDILARLARRGDPARAGAEAALRRLAVARSRPRGLGAMLARHLPAGTVYLNVGHTALSDALLSGLDAVPSRRIALMIHDTIPLDWPGFQGPGAPERFRAFLDRAVRSADMILSNSAVTAADLARHAAPPLPETVVAHLGVPAPRPGTAPGGPWRTPFFVTIGTIEPRKNHGFLLDLWEEMAPHAPDLLILGARGWENRHTLARLDARPPRIHELGGLSDAALFALLGQSAGLLFPSHAEGYGLPLLEAARLGVPAICNDLPVFREIAFEVPIFASVSDKASWRAAIEDLVARALAAGSETGAEAPGGPEQPTGKDWDAHFGIVLQHL